MIIFVDQTPVFIKVLGVVANLVAIFLVLHNFVTAAGRIIIRGISDKPHFPYIAVWADIFFL